MATPGWVLKNEIGYCVLTFKVDGRKWAAIAWDAELDNKLCVVAWSWMICNFSKVGDLVTLDQDGLDYVVSAKYLGVGLRVGEGPKPQTLVLHRAA